VASISWAASTANASPGQSIPGDGTYRVGVDIPPGVYITKGGRDGYSCGWSRHSTLARTRTTSSTSARRKVSRLSPSRRQTRHSRRASARFGRPPAMEMFRTWVRPRLPPKLLATYPASSTRQRVTRVPTPRTSSSPCRQMVRHSHVYRLHRLLDMSKRTRRRRPLSQCALRREQSTWTVGRWSADDVRGNAGQVGHLPRQLSGATIQQFLRRPLTTPSPRTERSARRIKRRAG
jgi:hypothetical protein